ncbi:adenine phosphoribosyltransferase-like [Watersipora subatra]|uniref:adenine phosphoribosyltransferase-like n=1 Tax=Watersipora subatra TaxID=2589382 RepID=UPI00355B4160
MADDQSKIERIAKTIKSFPDFPKPGILFKDIFPLLHDPAVFSDLVDVMTNNVRQLNVDVVIGLDARGFLFGPIIAYQLNIPFVPIRKKGKLPGPTMAVEYKLEYGSDIFEAQLQSIKEGQRVVIVDDLLATGGTMSAACELVEKMKGNIVECLVIIELNDLNGRSKITGKVHSLVQC